MTTQQQIKWLENYIALWDKTPGEMTSGLVDTYEKFTTWENLPSISADELIVYLKLIEFKGREIADTVYGMIQMIGEFEQTTGMRELTWHLSPNGCKVTDADGNELFDNSIIH